MKKANILDIILIVFILSSLCAGFYMLNADNFKKIYSGSNTFYEKKIDINELIEEYKSKYNVININYVNNDITCLLTTDENNNYYSFILDNTTGKIITLDNLIKENEQDGFNKKINELLLKKYAKFIVDGINNSSGSITYELKNNEMILYYQGFSFTPSYDKEISLHVNYNEVDKYLNYEHRLDLSYETEDGYNYSKDKVTVAFTFDDGPSGDYTYSVLKALEDNKMTATFFMVGNKMNNQYDVVKSVFNSPNEIGSHTYSHLNMKKNKQEKITEELNLTNDIYKGITGEEFKLTRPPYGAYTPEIIKDYSSSFILWNVDTNDWRYKDVDYIVNHILTHIEDGNIILMHDSYQTTIDAVKKVLPILYSKDVQVVSVSRLAKMRNIELENGKPYLYLK